MFFLSDYTVISIWPWTSVGIECIHTATKSLFVYHSGTPSIFSQLISPAGWAGAASGRATMWQWSIILIQSGDRDQGVTDHCWAQSQPRKYSVVWTGLCSIINIQRSESLRVRYQNQSWLMMIMTIYNEDDIFVLAKHQVLVKISPVQSSAVRKGISQRPGELDSIARACCHSRLTCARASWWENWCFGHIGHCDNHALNNLKSFGSNFLADKLEDIQTFVYLNIYYTDLHWN